jgi:hypothetical protein
MRSTSASPADERPTGLDQLRTAVETLRAETDSSPSGTVLDSELAELHRLIESLRSVFSTQLGDFDDAAGWLLSNTVLLWPAAPPPRPRGGLAAGWRPPSPAAVIDSRHECTPAAGAGRPDRGRYKSGVGRADG